MASMVRFVPDSTFAENVESFRIVSIPLVLYNQNSQPKKGDILILSTKHRIWSLILIFTNKHK
jgi:hypothetical protein